MNTYSGFRIDGTNPKMSLVHMGVHNVTTQLRDCAIYSESTVSEWLLVHERPFEAPKPGQASPWGNPASLENSAIWAKIHMDIARGRARYSKIC